MNFLGMGPMEVIIVLLVAFVFLGPERMVDAARLMGKGMRELKRLSAELPRIDLDDEDIIVSNRKPRSPGQEVYMGKPTQGSEGEDAASPAPADAKSDETGEEAPVAFSRGTADRVPDAGEAASPEEKP